MGHVFGKKGAFVVMIVDSVDMTVYAIGVAVYSVGMIIDMSLAGLGDVMGIDPLFQAVAESILKE